MMTQQNVNGSELRGLRVVRPVTLKARERDDRRESSRPALLAVIGSARAALQGERIAAGLGRCYCETCRRARHSAAEVSPAGSPRGWASLGDGATTH